MITQSAAGQTTTTVYRDILIEDVRAGRIARMTSPGGTIKVETKARGKHAAESLAGTFGATTIAGLDVAFLTRLYMQPAAAPNGPVQTVYDSFSAESFVLDNGKGTDVRLAKVSGKAVRARQGSLPWLRLPQVMAELDALDEDDHEGRLRIGLMLFGVLDGFELGETRLEGLEVRSVDAKKRLTSVRLANLSASLSAVSDGSFVLEGLSVDDGDSRFRLGTFALRDLALATTFAGLRDAARNGDKGMANIHPGALMPVIGSLVLRDIDFDVPSKAGEKANERVRMGLRGLEFVATKPVNGVPTSGRLAMEGLRFVLPKRDPNLKELIAMGYSTIEASATIESDWSPTTKDLEFSNFAINGVDMGSINSRILLGNAWEGLFSRDPAMNQIALVQLTFKAFDLRLQDKGLFGRLLTHLAAKQKTTVDALRAEYGMAAALAIPAMLGNSDSARKVGAAVAQFIAKPGVLSISAKARNPSGLGLADIGSLGNPAAIVDALDLEARAE
jgi:hypothetical protein